MQGSLLSKVEDEESEDEDFTHNVLVDEVPQ